MTDDDTPERAADGGAASDDAGPHAPPDDAEGIPPEQVEPGHEDAGESDRADPDEFFVPRDETGEVAEVETHVAGYGEVVVRPMVYGEVERYLGDAGAVAQAGPETIAEILRNHVVDPDLDEYARENFGEDVRAASRGEDTPANVYLTEAVVRDHMNPYAPQALLMAILRESGMDVNVAVDEAGEATIEFGDEGN